MPLIRRAITCHLCGKANATAVDRDGAGTVIYNVNNLDIHCAKKHTNIDDCLGSTYRRWRALDEEHSNILVSLKSENPTARLKANAMYCVQCRKLYEYTGDSETQALRLFAEHSPAADGIDKCAAIGTQRTSKRKGIPIKKEAMAGAGAGAGAGAAAAPARRGPCVVVDADYLEKELKGRDGRWKIKFDDEEFFDKDYNLQPDAALERIFQLAAETERLREERKATRATVTATQNPADTVLQMLKSMPPIPGMRNGKDVRAHIAKAEELAKQQAEENEDEFNALMLLFSLARDAYMALDTAGQCESKLSELHTELRLKDTELRQAKELAEARLSEVIELHDRLAAESASVTPPPSGGATHPVADDAPPLPASPQSDSSVPSLLVQGEEVVLPEAAC